MKTKIKLLALMLAASLCLSLGGCAEGATGGKNPTDSDVDSGTQTGNNQGISDSQTESGPLSDLTGSAEESIGEISAVPDEIPENATQITGKITIDQSGDYYVSSSIEGSKITVESEGVNLYLYNATLSNEKKVIESSYGLTLTLLGENSATNSNADGSNAIDCAGDLIINGSGSLSVASTKNGIKAKTIKVIGSTLIIDAAKDGLHAEIDAYDEAETQPVPSYDDGGFVYLSGADVKIDSVDDGIQADTFVYIDDDSVIDITSGGGAPDTVTSVTSDNASGKGIKAGAIDWGADATDLEWEDYLVCIKSGDITIDSNDDAIHSDGDVEIVGGNISATSGDDGVHADYNLLIGGGSVEISKCYEGIEGTNIEISGGEISVTSADDGLNAAGGADSSGFGGMDNGGWGRPGKFGTVNTPTYADEETPHIEISGGKIYVDSTADGIDSNGNITVSGGEIYISGPTSGADAAIDYDGTATVTGGIVVAAGKNGMSQNFGNSSTQGSLLLTTSSLGAGAVTVKDGSGNTIVSFTPTKSYNSVIISCPQFVVGSSYTVSACGKNVSVTLTSLILNKSF